MMVRRWLIVRGVRTTDELKQLGLPMAKRYEGANVVALIGNDGRGLVVKGAKDTILVELFDSDPSAGRCARAIRHVKQEYEKAHDVVGSSEVVGMFLFYWPLAADSVDVVMDAIERGDGSAVEMAAESFIESDFGATPKLPATLHADGDSHDAGGHAVGTAIDRAPGELPEAG